MRKEFEENEESENKSENNLETQDEIDDETFQKILEKEFIEREKRITAALFADDDVEDIKFTKEELDNSYQEFMRRIEREKKENTEVSEELVPDVDAVRRKEAASDEKRVISIEEIRDRRKKTAERELREEVSKEANTEEPNAKNRTTGGGLHRLGKVVGMAVVCVACVFAASMTSEANRKYLVNSVRVWSGDDTKTVNYNDPSNEDANLDEDKAIADVEEKLGVKVPEFYYRPYGMEFKNYEIDSYIDIAWIEYRYKKDIIIFYIDKQDDHRASKIDSLHGDEKDAIIVENDGINIKIKKIKDVSDNMANYSAEWCDENASYVLSGRIELEEIKKILENMEI